MIIGFCGRCRSGKTELAKICENYGYTKLYFALPLKQLCADILDMTMDELNKAKNENTPIQITIGNDICSILSEETEIPLETTKEICEGQYLHTVREMLQFIGTDYIRTYNKDWHVNRIKKMIQPNTNYVIDDVRFPNEKRLIEELGGDCWFITRTTLDNVSNHESETALKWQDCWNKIIINDSTLSAFQFKWETFLANYEQSSKIREEEFKKILETNTKDKITPLSLYDTLLLSKSFFEYVPKLFQQNDIKKITMNEDKTVFITYQNDSIELIENPLIIEELKMFL